MLMIPHKHSVHPPPFLLGGGEGGVSLLPNFQKEGGGGLTGPQLVEEGDFFRRGGQLLHKK